MAKKILKKDKKPAGIKVLAIILLVFAIFGVLSFILILVGLFLFSSISGDVGLKEIIQNIEKEGAFLTVYAIVLTTFISKLLILIASIGILKYKEISRKLLIVALAILFLLTIWNIIPQIISIYSGVSVGAGSFGLLFLILGIVWSVLTLGLYGISFWYFSREKIKTYFIS